MIIDRVYYNVFIENHFKNLHNTGKNSKKIVLMIKLIVCIQYSLTIVVYKSLIYFGF